MALLNEHRNRIPLVTFKPLDGDFGGIRGQMRMETVQGSTNIEVCTTGDTSGDYATATTIEGGDIGYTSVVKGSAGNGATITIDETTQNVTSAIIITVVADDITANVIGTGGPETSTSSAQDVVDAINADVDAQAVMTAAVINGATFTVHGETATLAGGLDNGRKSELTVDSGNSNGDVTYVDKEDTNVFKRKSPTNLVPGIEYIVGNANTSIVDIVITNGVDIAITADFSASTGGHTLTAKELAAAVNADPYASKLVTATAAEGNGLDTPGIGGQGLTKLIPPMSNAVWNTLLL